MNEKMLTPVKFLTEEVDSIFFPILQYENDGFISSEKSLPTYIN